MLSTFLGDILPPSGHYALWTKTDKQHTWYPSIEALTEGITDLGDAQGIYFATAAFNEQAANNGNKDARTQANVIGKKCFYLDLDAGAKKLAKHGPEKIYADHQDALTDLVEFCVATKLPPSYVISSGEGLHVYWALEATLEPGEWTRTARKLSKLFQQYGLKEDTAVTTDSARILRPIGTLHENGKTVKILQASRKLYDASSFADRVANLLEDTSDEFDLDSVPAKKFDTSINKDVVVEGPPKSIRKIAPKCRAIAATIKAKGNVEEPYWRAMLGIVKFTVEGDKAAHQISQGYPGYDKRETQRKLDNWKTGPTTCVEFAKHCSDCKKCEHKGKIKSPITLGYMNDVEVEKLPPELKPAPPAPPAPTGDPWDGAIPAGFFVKKGMLTYNMPTSKEDEDGIATSGTMEVPFTKDIFWFSQWADAENTDDTAQAFMHKWDGRRVIAYMLEQSLLANQQKFREFLAGKSVIVGSHPKAPKAMEEYAKAQLELIKSAPSRHKVNKRFGMFITPEGELMCAHGEYIIQPDGEIHRAIMGPAVREVSTGFEMPIPYNAKGVWGPEVWDDEILPKARRHVEFMRKYYRTEGLEKYQLAASIAIASPLMAFVTGEYVKGNILPANGLSVSLFSQEGGRGKTTLMRSSLMAYGTPSVMSKDQNQSGSTDIGRIEKLSLRGTMPIGMDEMGATPAKTVAELISAIANGSSRDRAKPGGGLTAGTPWALVALFAANKSARDMVAAANAESGAIQFRLLELDVDNIMEFDAETRSRFQTDWSGVADCAGALGAVVHREMCRMGVAGVNKLVMECVNRISETTEKGIQTGRFQYRGLGAAMALQLILKRLGLDMFDWKVLQDTFQKAHDNGIAYVKENTLPTDGLALLNIALHDMTPHTAVTADETRRTRHVTAYDEPLVPTPLVIHARHVVSTLKTYVSAAALREWCADRKVSFTKIIGDAKTAGVMGSVYESIKEGNAKPYNLLKGMRGSTESMVSCYAFDISKLARETGTHPHRTITETLGNVVPLLTDATVKVEAAKKKAS